MNATTINLRGPRQPSADANGKEMDGFAAQGVELAMADTRPR